MDAAYDSKDRSAKLGAVAQDSEGIVCFCAITKNEHIDSSFHAEMKAILYGFELARKHGFVFMI